MDASQRPLLRVIRDAALHDSGIQALGLKFLLAPRARKKTALIAIELEVDFENSRQLGLTKGRLRLTALRLQIFTQLSWQSSACPASPQYPRRGRPFNQGCFARHFNDIHFHNHGMTGNTGTRNLMSFIAASAMNSLGFMPLPVVWLNRRKRFALWPQ